MSFGLLKHFKDLKKGDSATVSTAHSKHMILGHDLSAVMKLLEIRREHPEDKVKLISTRLISRQALIEAHDYSPSFIRSKEAVEGIFKRHFNSRLHPQNRPALFFKEGKFHDFGGRAKSMDLQPGEDYFLTPGYRLDLSSLFSEEEWENLDTILAQHHEIRIPESVEKMTPSDLVDRTEWLVTFKDYTRLTCENLYVGISPKKFAHLLTHKETLTPELIDLCTSLNVQAALAVTWELDKDVYPEERTLFIPQSMTHEWGHFIVEFEAFDYHRKKQPCHVLFLVHEEEPSPEDLGSKIKLMKRVLDRVFPGIERHITKEFIRFDEEMFISDVKEQALEQVGFDYPTLKFLGQVAPVPAPFAQQKFLTRTLLSH